MSVHDLVGKKFGRLMVDSFAGTRGGNAWWSCVCSCGARRTIVAHSLVGGVSKSCGCLAKEVAAKQISTLRRTHGYTNTPEHNVWENIIARCCNPKHPSFSNYGGRGIGICQEWRNSFEAFLANVGPRPSSVHTIERIDNNKWYEPGNVKWATRREQQRNRRSNRMLVIGGETRTITEWSELSGINIGTLYKRIARGVCLEEAIQQPVDSAKSHGREQVSSCCY